MSLVYSLDHRHDLNPAALAELIGGKAASLAVMAADLGLPVPRGFAITTEACREFLTGGWPAGLDDELRPAMERLGHAAGRRFGDFTILPSTRVSCFTRTESTSGAIRMISLSLSVQRAGQSEMLDRAAASTICRSEAAGACQAHPDHAGTTASSRTMSRR